MLETSKLRVFTTMRCCVRLGFDQLVMFFFVFATHWPGAIRSTHRIFGLTFVSTMVVHYALRDLVPLNNVLVPYTIIMVQHLHTPWGQEWPTRKFPGIYAVDTRL